MEGGDGGGVVRVEVEDTSLAPDTGTGGGDRNEDGDEDEWNGGMEVDMDRGEIFEGVEHEGTWILPSQGLGAGVRIAPTARPPL